MFYANGDLTNDDKSKAEALYYFFTSVFTREDIEDIPDLAEQNYTSPLMSIEVTSEGVLKKLQKLNASKSAGSDELHPRVLKETAEVICVPLSIIFKKSLEEGKLPSVWKQGNITPLHKKGDKKRSENYRPISLTPVVGKVLESIIRDVLVDHMMQNKLFCDEQHGFVPGRSCMT